MWRTKKNNRNNIKTKTKIFRIHVHDNKLRMLCNVLFVIWFSLSTPGHILETQKKQEKNISNLKVGIGNYEKELLWDVSWSQRTFGRWWSHCIEMRIGFKENVFRGEIEKRYFVFGCIIVRCRIKRIQFMLIVWVFKHWFIIHE